MNLFGFKIERSKKEQDVVDAIVSPNASDGSTVVNTGVNAGGYYGMVMDMEGIIKNENDLIRRYREIATYSDCDSAIEDIVGESVVYSDQDQSITINLDDVELSDSIKDKIRLEFEAVLKLLKFNVRGHDIFRSWYIDGRLYYHIILDEENLKRGIVELRYIDPRKVRKIKNISKVRTPKGVEVVKSVEEYYLYNDKGITEQTTQGVKLSLDSVVYVPSGYMDSNTGMMMSYLHKAIKPTNQLKMIEDSLVIYRISRAPERRIFYVDVGNLPKIKAEQYVNDIMNKFRNKIVYDATTGETRDDRRQLSMMEDFWMPRREGSKGTEITTLPGGQNLSNLEDVEHFQEKLYRALNVPIGRLQAQGGFSIGRAQEISRDEIKFNKFIMRLRAKFSSIFTDALRVQLIAKGIIRADEWQEIGDNIRYNYLQENHYSELMDAEVLNGRLATLTQLDPYIGRYYSMEWVKRNVLHQTEDEIKEMEKQIAAEPPPIDPMGDGSGEMQQEAPAPAPAPSKPEPKQKKESK